ncbi:MAG TPA: tRNA (adenosine(37)-N6)-dimethylallyltransferase MiaA, partial [Flavobacteriaceae bacterium]|nr:tRNA (adenosine(37)-N6)-dimethylallyltransferase MiaA [Flavobacteriaceae bacterium]
YIMMEAGLFKEVAELVPHKNLNALQTVGYRELFDHLEGNSTLEEAVSEIKKNTRRFAKRQNTWFKKNESIMWFDYTTTASEIIKTIKLKNAL